MASGQRAWLFGLCAACGRLAFDAELADAPGAMPAMQFQDGLWPEPSYTGTRDTTLEESAPAQPAGLSSRCKADGSDGPLNLDLAALVAWDVSAIPPGSVVRAASMTLATSSSHDAYGVFEVLRPWIETQATWQEASTGVAWDLPGAAAGTDRGTMLLGVIPNVNPPGAGPVTIALDGDGVAAVQRWVDDRSHNHGLIIFDAASDNGFSFSSRQSGVAEERPRLTILYDPP